MLNCVTLYCVSAKVLSLLQLTLSHFTQCNLTVIRTTWGQPALYATVLIFNRVYFGVKGPEVNY